MANINKTEFDSKHYWEVSLGYGEQIRKGIDKIEVSWEEILSSPAAQQIKSIDFDTNNTGEFDFSESPASGSTANYKIIKGVEKESVWKESEEYTAPGQPLETFWQVHNIPFLNTWQVVVSIGKNIIAMTSMSNKLTKSDAYAITEIDWGENTTPFWGGVAPKLLRGPTVHVDDSASTGEKIYSLIIKEREKIKYEIRLVGTKTITAPPTPPTPPPPPPPGTSPPPATVVPPGPTPNHSLIEWSAIANALANGAKGFFKKMVGASDPIGTLTVVCPELITKKGFDAATEYSDTIMKVPAKNFYNYLGHWLTPDVGLKNGTYTDPYSPNEKIQGRGLNIGPFSYDQDTSTYNDLTRALDGKVYSNSGSVNRPSHEAKGPGEIMKLLVSSEKHCERLEPKNFPSSDDKQRIYETGGGQTHNYVWKGNWNDSENAFETSATFDITFDIDCERVWGNLTGDLNPTGAKVLVWCGDENDYDGDNSDSSNYYSVPSNYTIEGNVNPSHNFGKYLKKYFNPLFSTGELFVGNNGRIVKTLTATIYREPFSRQINWHAVIYVRGGKKDFGLMSLINAVRPSGVIGILDSISSLVGVKVGTKAWELVTLPFSALATFIDSLFGQGYASVGEISIGVSKKTMAQVDSDDAKSHPAILNFGEINENSYMYTQFEYPAFDRNSCYPFTDFLNYRKPMFNNQVIESRYNWTNPDYDHKLMRKYKYYIPNLFRLTFETRQGVFLEQLAKQHKNNNISLDLSFQIKQNQHNVKIDPTRPRTVSDHEQNLDDLFFPTNSDKWNVFIENGWGDTGTAMNLTFLQNFIDTATIPATQQAETMPYEYSDVFVDYPFLDVSSISEINNIIGNHNDIKHILESDVGYELNTWTQACADASQFSTLSSGSPKNLSFKIIEYMLWYLDQDGIAFKTRNNVRSLIEYETYLDQEIKDQKGASGGNNLDDYHIIGTELYERECKE
jgi:hypothetical protein